MTSRRLVRSPHTPVVHKDTCRSTMRPGTKFVHWKWADTVSIAEVRQALKTPGNRPCKQCIPGGADWL